MGFKNGTDGNIKIAADAISTAAHPHHFFSTSPEGRATIITTTGNKDGHLILRGGKTPNFDKHSVDLACAELIRSGRIGKVMIDASHANSAKMHAKQIPICTDIGRRIAAGDTRIMGVMIESNLVAGRQDAQPGCKLTYGQSITDACVDWADTVEMLEGLAEAVKQRRIPRQTAPESCLATAT